MAVPALAIVVATLATILVATGCERRHAAPQATGGSATTEPQVLRRGLGGEPGTLDPHRADDTFAFEILRDLYEELTVSDPSGEVVPGAAESWTVDGDGLQFVFRLRPGLQWSNGDPLLAEHFAAGLRRAVDPATAAPGADLLRPILNAAAIVQGKRPPGDLGVRAIDATTLEIRLASPCPYLPDILTNSIAAPLHPAARFPAPAAVTISNGAYQLVANDPGMPISLRRNPRYWNAAAVPIAAVRYFPVADESVEFNRFRAGDLDVTNNVPTSRFAELRADPSVRLQVRPTLATFFYSFNDKRGPFKGNPRLREALALVIDREAITEKVTRAGQVPAYSLVPPGVWNYQPATFAWNELPAAARLLRARELYAAAGYSATRPLRIRLVFNQNELIKSVTIAIAAAWKEALGVETELVQLEYRVYLDARDDPSQWDVIRMGWSADYNDATSFLDTFVTGSPQNHGGWSSAAYDALLARAHATADVAARRVLLQQAESLLLQDVAMAPAYFYVARRLVRPGVEVATLNPLNRNYSRNFRFVAVN